MDATILVPTEHAEQVVVVNWLTRRGVVFFAVPNGGKRGPVTGRLLKSEGVQAGVPDVIIISPPPKHQGKVGVALEMKRVVGGRVTTEQAEWLIEFERAGWLTIVGRGCENAIKQLQEAGY